MTDSASRMRSQPRWFWPALLPVVAGLFWLAVGWRAGLAAGLVMSPTGSLMLAPGLALLLFPGDRQISHYLAFGALSGVLLSSALWPFLGLLVALGLAGLALLSFFVAGYTAVFQAAAGADVPVPRLDWRLAGKAAWDEAILAYFVGTARVPTGQQVAGDAIELARLRDLGEARGWLAEPDHLHPVPPPPVKPTLNHRYVAGQRFLLLRFDSGYVPDPALPGAERWQAQTANQRMAARVFRHPGAARPWLLCIHGYRMGRPAIDFSLFQIDRLHRQLGYNLLMPILPLHGERKIHARSGSGFLDGHMADIFHAESQALWDLRRTLAWLREREPAAEVGVLGYSLGAYNAALLSALDDDLRCVIAGIPLADMADVVWRHLPILHLRYIEAAGVTPALARAALAPVSPLLLPCRVPADRRFVFAATGDQLVPPGQATRLAGHWGGAPIHWYHGSHLSARREASVQTFIEQCLDQSGLAPPIADMSGCLRPAQT